MNWILPALADSEGVLIEKPWLRVHVRRGANRAASGMVFLGTGGGCTLRTNLLRLPVSPEVLLLTVVTEGAEGAPENLFRLPLRTALSTVCGEESMVSTHTTAPLLQVWRLFFSWGARPNGTQTHDLPQIHTQWRKCSWFRTWYYSTPT